MGEVGELCDGAEINTQNDGNVNFMMGSAVVYQQIGGKIKSKSGNSIVIYTQKKERLSLIAKESVGKDFKEELDIEKPKKSRKKKEEIEENVEVPADFEEEKATEEPEAIEPEAEVIEVEVEEKKED